MKLKKAKSAKRQQERVKKGEYRETCNMNRETEK